MHIGQLIKDLQKTLSVSNEVSRSIREIIQSAENALTFRDEFVVHLYKSRKAFREEIYKDRKTTRDKELIIMRSFQEAQRLHFKGSQLDWLRVLEPGIVFTPARPDPCIYTGHPPKP